jgi:hypothetical protein
MAGILKVDKYQDFNGNDIMTSDGSGNITMPSGVISGQNYPAFEAYRDVTANLTNLSYSKIECDTELFDTDNCYDNSTNYRFTPNVAGKYFVYAFAGVNTGGNSRLEQNWGVIYKNGNATIQAQNDYGANPIRINAVNVSGVIDMNGTTDYLEFYIYPESNSGTPNYLGSSGTYYRTAFGAYRIGS